LLLNAGGRHDFTKRMLVSPVRKPLEALKIASKSFRHVRKIVKSDY